MSSTFSVFQADFKRFQGVLGGLFGGYRTTHPPPHPKGVYQLLGGSELPA